MNKKYFNKIQNYMIDYRQYNKGYNINLDSNVEQWQLITKLSNPIQINSLKEGYNNFIQNFINSNSTIKVILLNSKIVNHGIVEFNKIKFDTIINITTNTKTNYIKDNQDNIRVIIDYNKGIIITNINFTSFQLSFNNSNIINQLKVYCYIKQNNLKNSQNKTIVDDIQIYLNTIGIYDEKNNLLMVGRLNRNLKKKGSQNFILKNQF